MKSTVAHADIVWQPSAEVVAQARLSHFMQALGISAPGRGGYDELLARADANPEWFWNQVIAYCGIRFYRDYTRIMDTSRGIAWTEWCVGGITNLVLNCLDRHRGTPVWAKPALCWEGENGDRREFRYAELAAATSRLAAGLTALGIGKGDVVGLYIPTIPEAAVALLAVAKIGAIILPLFSGFGPPAIATRLNDARAVAVIAADATWRRGKCVEMKTALDAAAREVSTLKHIIVVRNAGAEIQWTAGRDHWWHDVCAGQSENFPTTPMPADAPLMLMYTSGTTGKPKGTVHSHCGFLVKMALDLGLCLDYGPDDRLMWMSDMGWLVGPVLIVSSTFLGATMVLAEGAPDYPDERRYWQLICSNQVTLLGIAPTIVRNFMKVGGAGVTGFDLSRLRLTISTGEPWTPDSWHWMFDHVCRRRIPILNYSGGTEVGGGILTGTLLHPLKPCAFAGPIPGTGADLVDDEGRSISGAGVGELVMRRPSIGLTRGLWRAPERYLESYWNRYPGVWWHGDRAARDAEGFWYILGRSDDTLKIAGKRTGPSEIEALVMATGKIAEVAAIGVPDEVKGEVAVIVATPMPGVLADPALAATISSAVVAGLGAPFRPAAILFTSDLPKTRNMKIMRRVVKAAYLGQSAGDLSSLLNPESIDMVAAARAAATAAGAGEIG